METNDIIELFKKSHPKLISFNPQIEVSEIEVDEKGIVQNPPRLEILVWHPFIFDNRLIPKVFLGMKVINAVRFHTLPEILNPKDDSPLWEVENPNRYISFVEQNIDEIRIKLKSESLSKYDALDALTGNFQEYLKEWGSLVLIYFG